MPYQNITAQISDADRQAILAAVAAVRAKLPFLVTLTAEERRALPKTGLRRQPFVAGCARVAEAHPEVLPSAFDAQGFARDAALTDDLTAIASLLQVLTAEVTDTLMAVSSETFRASSEVYNYVQTAARRTPGLRVVADDLKRAVKAPPKSDPKPATPVTPQK